MGVQQPVSFYRCNLSEGKCVICGQLNSTGFPDELVRMQCKASPCKLLGKETTPIKVTCLSCNSTPIALMQPAHYCNHPNVLRCLPDYVPANIHEWKEKPESNIYHLCRYCPHYQS